MQFGAKPLFENISVKFGDGNRYGLIGANGCGKSTFMKILGGDLEPSRRQRHARSERAPGQAAPGPVRLRRHARARRGDDGPHRDVGRDAAERDAIYANPDATDDDYMHAAELEGKVAEYDGYTAEARAGELLLGARRRHRAAPGPDERRGAGLEAARAAGAGAVLESGHPAARRADQQPGHQHDPLAGRRAQRAQLHHDHHFPRSPLPEPGLHPRGRHGLRHAEGLSGQLRRLHVRLDPGAQPATGRTTPRPRKRSPSCRTSCAASRPTSPRRARPRRAPSRSRRSRSTTSSHRRAPIRSCASKARRSCTAWRWKSRTSRKATTASCSRTSASWSRPASASPSSAPTAPARPRCCAASAASCAGLQPDQRPRQVGRERQRRLHAAGSDRRFRRRTRT